MNHQKSSQDHFDAIVIGVGSMGSSTCCFLAERGYKVLGIEQFNIVHDKGSHSGQSRIIRKAYFEHPDYVPLLERSYHNWRLTEQKTNSKIYERTGILYMGRADSVVLSGVQNSATQYQVDVKTITKEEAGIQFPSFRIPDNFISLLEPDAGFVTPEKAIRVYVDEAIKNGARILTQETAIDWREDSGKIRVFTSKGNYSCEKLIITAGSWASEVVPELRTALKVTKQMVAWVNPKDKDAFSLGKFPCWFIDDPDKGSYYGFPILPVSDFGEPFGLKLAHHVHGELCDPNHVDRESIPGTEEDLRYVLEKYIPGAIGDFTTIKSCLYTNTSDENFIIDHLPGYSKKVTIACGFSGHGFKFVSVVGEILADLAMKGRTELPVGFLRLSRFDQK